MNTDNNVDQNYIQVDGDVDYANMEWLSYTTSATPPCKHGTGWFGGVSFWLFTKKIYTCSDCGKILEGKRLKKFRYKLK